MTDGLSLQRVTVRYRDKTALQGLSVPDIPPGTLVAIIGPNAAGKSTLLRAIAGLHPAEGLVALDSVPLTGPVRDRNPQTLGYLPQSLPQGSRLVAYEAVLSACRAIRSDFSRRQAEQAIDAVFDVLALTDLALRRLDELSGGQRQLVGLAQVLVRKPPLLLLDEPTSALDLHWQLNVLETVREIVRRDRAICLAAMHDINLALRFADLVVVLEGGRALAAGPPGDVMSADLLRQAYGVLGRIEHCSKGLPIVLSDRALRPDV